jgi:hypothetical protein
LTSSLQRHTNNETVDGHITSATDGRGSPAAKWIPFAFAGVRRAQSNIFEHRADRPDLTFVLPVPVPMVASYARRQHEAAGGDAFKTT